jgi:hypothetical protein
VVVRGGGPLDALRAAVAADRHRDGRARVPLASGPRRREAQAGAAARPGCAARASARPQCLDDRRDAGVRRALARRHPGRLREGGGRHAGGVDPRARRRDGPAACRPSLRDLRRIPGLAARWLGVLLLGTARGRRAGECCLRARARVGRAHPPHLRERGAVLVLGRGQRVRPLRGAVPVGLRPRQRRLPAAAPRRNARAGGTRAALGEPRAGDRRRDSRPHRPRRIARASLHRLARGADGVADADRRGPGHAAIGHGRRRPAVRRLLAPRVAPGAHPRRRMGPASASSSCRGSAR